MLARAETPAAKPKPARPNILFCLADDWGWPHAGVYGDKTVKTPAFDRLAREGALFTRAYSSAPTCTPSRAAILTGRAVHQLEQGAQLYGPLPSKFEVYPDLLERAGYVVGYTGKGWAPGNFNEGGRSRNPAGPQFKNFQAFLKTVPAGKPFCFWFGSHRPHRPYEPGQGTKAGLDAAGVRPPPCWPDVPEVRSDILDYYENVQIFDRQMGYLLATLENKGLSENTLVVATGDNGWPFPRGKANLYDIGGHQPLAVRWPAWFKGGRVSEDFVNLYDLAPTFLEAAGLDPLKAMTGRSILPLLEGKSQPGRDTVFVERERHANARKGDLSYPSRAIRTADFLYIRNLRPDRWPAGDPEKYISVGEYADCDDSPTKQWILDHRGKTGKVDSFKLCFDLRPVEELYDLRKDPDELNNVAEQPEYFARKQAFRMRLENWMKDTGDPRASRDDDHWDRYPYSGPAK